MFGDVIHKPHSFISFNKWYIIQDIVCISKKLQNIVWCTTALIYVFPLNKSGSLQMKAWLVKPVKHDLSSRSSVFTPVLPISKTEILSGKGILPDNGIQYIPRSCFFFENANLAKLKRSILPTFWHLWSCNEFVNLKCI